MKRTIFALAFAPVMAMASDAIVIGQTADFSSVASAQMKSFNAGAAAYFAEVNKRGGINGRPIKLTSLDDGFSADRARVNAQSLVANKDVVMIFGPRGTDPSEAVISEAEKADIAVVAPITGADSVRSSPVSFPVRTTYRQEIIEMLKHASLSAPNMVVLVQDDKFGNPLYSFIQEEVKQNYPGVKIVGKVTFDRKNANMKEEAGKVLSYNPLSVIALCNPTSCGSFVKNVTEQALKQQVVKPVVYQTSISDMYDQYEKLGSKTIAGSPYSQVMPNPMNDIYTVSREFTTLMRKTDGPMDYRAFEGFLSAKVAVQGLIKAKKIARQEVRAALENLGIYDMGGFSVTYKPGHRLGSSFAELVSISTTGKMIR